MIKNIYQSQVRIQFLTPSCQSSPSLSLPELEVAKSTTGLAAFTGTTVFVGLTVAAFPIVGAALFFLSDDHLPSSLMPRALGVLILRLSVAGLWPLA